MPMRQLRSCEFCGDDAAGVYEVFPPELSPTEAEQRRVVLCADCAKTLENVVDPLLDRLGVDTDDGASAGDSDDGTDERSVAAEAALTDEPGTDAESEADPAPDDPDRGPTAGPDPEEEPVQWGDPDPTDEAGSAEPDRSPSEPVRNGIPGVDTSDDDSGVGESESPDGVDDATTDDTDDAGGGDTGAREGDGATPGEEPAEFRTVMRLLGNREFPVERDAIVELAANAYELDEGHVHRILDHAVDRGVIDDDGGTLRRN